MSFDDFDISSVINSKKMGAKRLDVLRRHLIEGIKPLDPSIVDLFELAEEKTNRIVDTDGEFQPTPSGKGREVVYVTAPSGAGKSTWISKYCYNYMKMFPKNRVILLSRLNDDDALDKIKGLSRLTIDQELVDNPIDCVKELANTLVIFDDVDTIKDKALKQALIHLQDDILQVGRHSNTTIIISSHLATNYKDTKIVLAESHKIVVFPEASSAYSMRYLLTKYIGLDKA